MRGHYDEYQRRCFQASSRGTQGVQNPTAFDRRGIRGLERRASRAMVLQGSACHSSSHCIETLLDPSGPFLRLHST